jgi:hypothetical protein
MNKASISALQKCRTGYFLGWQLKFSPYISDTLCGRRTHLDGPKTLAFATAI